MEQNKSSNKPKEWVKAFLENGKLNVIPSLIVSLALFLCFSQYYSSQLDSLKKQIDGKNDIQKLKDENAMIKAEIQEIKSQRSFMPVIVCHDCPVAEKKTPKK